MIKYCIQFQLLSHFKDIKHLPPTEWCTEMTLSQLQRNINYLQMVNKAASGDY